MAANISRLARSRGLSAEDRLLWAAFSQNIVLLPGRTRAAPPLAAEPPTPPKPPKPVPPPLPVAKPLRQASISVGATPAGLDKSTWAKFTSGKTKAVRRLDLHGLTAAGSHQAVHRFIEGAYAGQLRCIEIITGNGDVLARELPHWLNAPALRRLILAVAHPHRANTGAVRILLRRAR